MCAHTVYKNFNLFPHAFSSSCNWPLPYFSVPCLFSEPLATLSIIPFHIFIAHHFFNSFLLYSFPLVLISFVPVHRRLAAPCLFHPLPFLSPYFYFVLSDLILLSFYISLLPACFFFSHPVSLCALFVVGRWGSLSLLMPLQMSDRAPTACAISSAGGYPATLMSLLEVCGGVRYGTVRSVHLLRD